MALALRAGDGERRRLLLFDDKEVFSGGQRIGITYLDFLADWERCVVRRQDAPEPPETWPCEHFETIVVPEFPLGLSRPSTQLRLLPTVWGYAQRLDAILRRHRPHLVIANTMTCLIPLALIPRWPRPPVIHMFHTSDLPTGRAANWLLGSTRYHLAVSSDALAQVPESARATSMVLPPPVTLPPVTAPSPLRSELGWADRWVVGFVGRLSPEKNLPALLEAVARTAGTDLDDLRLILVGEGPARGALEALAARLELGERVHFAGHRADVPALLPTFDGFALVSLCEGSPLVVSEAQIAGLPVLTTPAKGSRELVEQGRLGVMTEGFGSAELLAGLRQLRQRRPHDEGCRQAQAVARARHDPEHIRTQLREYVDRLVPPRPGGTPCA